MLPKKNLTTIDGVNRIPTIPPPRHRTIGTIDRSLNDESLGIQKKQNCGTKKRTSSNHSRAFNKHVAQNEKTGTIKSIT